MRVLLVASYNKERFAPFVSEQAQALTDSGCELRFFGIQGKGPLGYLRQLPRLRREIHAFRPDVIHAHYGLSGLLANLQRRVPVVTTYHGSDINHPRVRPFSRIAMALSAWNIFVSRRTMALVGADKHSRASLLPCGVDLTEDQLQSRQQARTALGWGEEEKRVLFAGAFDNAVKDPALAQAAVAQLDGVELCELKGYTRGQVNTLLCAADCLLLTSHTEGSPQVIKEAMACNCPIVSVDVGDVAERTADVEGCYVARTRSPHELAALLTRVLARSARSDGRNRLIEQGLSNAQVAQRILTLYQQIAR